MKKTILLVPILLFMVACSAGRKAAEQAYTSLASEKFEGEVKYVKSPGKKYVLCISDKQPSQSNAQNQLKFFVYDVKANTMTFELNVGNGTVKWASSTELEVFRVPGVMPKDRTRDDFTTIYDAATGQGRPKK